MDFVLGAIAGLLVIATRYAALRNLRPSLVPWGKVCRSTTNIYLHNDNRTSVLSTVLNILCASSHLILFNILR